MLKFKETVTIELKGDSCIIRCGTKEYTIKDDKEVYYNKFKRRMWSSGSLTDEEIQFLTSNNLVVKEYINNYLNTEFEKNIYFFEDLSENLQISPNDIQKSIFEKNIVILGCGGVGTVVLKNLLAFGVKKFILIDYDKVEISNLNRQLFYTRNDVGERKVDVFSRKIEEEFKEVEVITLADKVASKKIEKLNKYKCDNIVLCADKPCDISNIVSKYAKKISAAVFSGYVGIVTGTWGSTLNSYEDLHKKCTTSTLSEGINLWNFIPENNNFLFKKSTIATIKCLSPDYYPNNIICNYISKYLAHYNIEVNWVMRPLK